MIPAAQLIAVRVHLERLAELARVADEAASEGDYQRRRRRFRPGAVLMFFAPLLVGWWLVLGLGVGMSAMFGALALWPSLASNQITGSLAGLGAILIWAGWVAALRLVLVRRRAVVAGLPTTAAEARCGQCGATAPVLIGHAMQCPFCAADLIPDATARAVAEASVGHRVNQLRAQATVEAFHTEASRSPALENLITMMTTAQLVTIGLACVVSVVVIVTAIAKLL